MTMRTAPTIGVDIHFGPDSIKHRYYPGDDKCHAYGVLKIDNGSSTYANLYFDTDPAHIDKMIAELVALKQEMDPPVITDSESLKVYARPCTDEPGAHDNCGRMDLCDCDCHDGDAAPVADESADIAYDRTHPDPYRTWVNGEQPEPSVTA